MRGDARHYRTAFTQVKSRLRDLMDLICTIEDPRINHDIETISQRLDYVAASLKRSAALIEEQSKKMGASNGSKNSKSLQRRK